MREFFQYPGAQPSGKSSGVIAYKSALSDDDVLLVMGYLANKYRVGAVGQW